MKERFNISTQGFFINFWNFLQANNIMATKKKKWKPGKSLGGKSYKNVNVGREIRSPICGLDIGMNVYIGVFSKIVKGWESLIIFPTNLYQNVWQDFKYTSGTYKLKPCRFVIFCAGKGHLIRKRCRNSCELTIGSTNTLSNTSFLFVYAKYLWG